MGLAASPAGVCGATWRRRLSRAVADCRRHAASLLQLARSRPARTGFILLLWCVHAFYRRGRGLLHRAMPQVLVVQGIYGVCRDDPMSSIILILWGWAIGLASRPLAVLAAASCSRLVCVWYQQEAVVVSAVRQPWARYAARVPRAGWDACLAPSATRLSTIPTRPMTLLAGLARRTASSGRAGMKSYDDLRDRYLAHGRSAQN